MIVLALILWEASQGARICVLRMYLVLLFLPLSDFAGVIWK